MQQKTVFSTVLSDALRKNDSTHGLAPEASAARILLHLREAYPYILKTDGLPCSDMPSAAPLQPVGSQRILLAYLNVLLKTNPDDLQDTGLPGLKQNAPLEHPSSAINSPGPTEPRPSESGNSLANAHHSDSSGFSDETQNEVEIFNTRLLLTKIVVFFKNKWDKEKLPRVKALLIQNFQMVLMQFHSLASTCPGMDWDERHRNWSSNRLYDKTCDQNITVIASPAETLNLVCAALLDHARFEDGIAGFELRLHSFCNQLIDLQKVKMAKSREVCSTGRQHGLLFLLNHAYKVLNPQSRQMQPIKLITDTPAFLLESANTFLLDKLRLLPDDHSRLLVQSISPDSSEDMGEAPVLQWLNQQFHGEGTKAFADYLQQMCQNIGLNPEEREVKNKISEMASQLEYLKVPVDPGSLQETLEIILSYNLINNVHPAFSSLMTAYNQALSKLKSTLYGSPEVLYSQYHPMLNDFRTARALIDSWYAEHDIALGMGACDLFFKHAKLEMVQNYFNHFSLQNPIPIELSEIKQDFKAMAQLLRQEYNEFINTFLPDLFNISTLDAQINTSTLDAQKRVKCISRLELMKAETVGKTNFVFLRPKEINTLLRRNPSFFSSEETQRIILSAIISDVAGWTPNHRELLAKLIGWFQTPGIQIPPSTQTVWTNIPPFVIKKWIMILKFYQVGLFTAPLCAHFNKNIRTDIAFNWADLLRMSLATMTPENINPILAYLLQQRFIQNVEELLPILSLDTKQLIEPQRMGLLAYAENKWKQWVTSVPPCIGLLHLPVQLFPQRARELLITTILDRLDTLSHWDNISLMYLLKYGSLSVNNVQQQTMFIFFQAKILQMNTTNDFSFSKLSIYINLTLEQFPQAQRNLLIENHAKLLGQYKSDSWSLKHDLSGKNMTDVDRLNLLTAIKPQLTGILSTGKALVDIFSLPELNDAHRCFIYDLIRPQAIIKPLKFIAAFTLAPEQFAKGDRDQLFAALSQTSLKNIHDITSFLSQPLNQVPLNYRNKLHHNLTGKWPGIFLKICDVATIFSLDLELLPVEKRKDLLREANKVVSTTMKITIVGLTKLLSLNFDQVSKAQRDELFIAMKSNQTLDQMAVNTCNLRPLFKLSPDEFSMAHRMFIFDVIHSKIAALYVGRNKGLCPLFNLSREQFSIEQRTTLNRDMAAIKSQLPQSPHSDLGFFAQTQRGAAAAAECDASYMQDEEKDVERADDEKEHDDIKIPASSVRKRKNEHDDIEITALSVRKQHKLG